MKIERVKPVPEFKPVVLTIESKAELEVLYQVCNYNDTISTMVKMDVLSAGKVRGVLKDIYKGLHAQGINSSTFKE